MSVPSGSQIREVRTGSGLTVVVERFGGPSELPLVLLLHGGGQTPLVQHPGLSAHPVDHRSQLRLLRR